MGNLNRLPGCNSLPGLGRSAQRVMVMTDDRIFYCGLLGLRSMSLLGSVTVYVSFDGPLSVCFDDGRTLVGTCAAVAPYVPHRIVSSDPCIGILNLEPELIDIAALPWLGDGPDAAEALEHLAVRIRALYARLAAGEAGDILLDLDIDTPLFGASIPRRRLDPRIAAVVERIREDPTTHFHAERCADDSALSFSRFLHLFRSETGVPFRRFKAWKRARTMLRYVNQEANLTEIALKIGYPGGSHFSNTIRHVFGLKPRDMFAGARRLRLVTGFDAR